MLSVVEIIRFSDICIYFDIKIKNMLGFKTI